MNFKETKILETGQVERIKNPEQAKEYIQILFDKYTKWKPCFFHEIDTDIKAITHNQRLRFNMKNTTPDHKVFTNNVDNGLVLIKDASFALMKAYTTKSGAKEDMFEFAKAEFNSRLENSFDEKLFIENELQKFTDFENRAKELQKEVYKNDAVLNEYQRQYENKYGWHFSEFEYLRMITGFYHYPDRENKKSFYFLPTLVKHKLLKSYIQEIYNQKFNPNTDTRPTGFTCNLPPETVEEIFKTMQAKDQISGKLEDFKAIFSQTPQPVTEPVKWLLEHREKANNSAFHAFLRLMLDCRNKELTRDTLKKANKLFTCNNKPIYPNDEIKYPSSKEKDRWMKSSIAKHFSKISHLIEKQDQK